MYESFTVVIMVEDFFMRRGAQMKLLLMQRVTRAASREDESSLLDCDGKLRR